MSNLQFSVNAIFPLILTVLVGYVCKRIGLISPDLAKGMNRLVFRLFLPVMLFMNVYRIERLATVDLTFVWYTLLFTLAWTALSIPLTRLVTRERNQRGVLLQAAFRSNFALVGIPLASALFGEAGVAVAALLSAFIIPCYNILAVICLSVYADRAEKRISLKKIGLDIVKNPLIGAIACGATVLLIREIFLRTGVTFRMTDLPFLEKTLSSLSAVATPLSLVVLGAQFEFSAVKELRRQILFGVLMRGVILPATGLSIAYLLGCFNGAHFAAFAATFATPIAVSSVPMAQEMGADTRLAGQLVVWTTLTSAATLFAVATILKSVGVF